MSNTCIKLVTTKAQQSFITPKLILNYDRRLHLLCSHGDCRNAGRTWGLIWHVNCLRAVLQMKALNLKVMLSPWRAWAVCSRAECPEPLPWSTALPL